METVNNEEILRGLELVKEEAKRHIKALKEEISTHKQILYRSEKAIVNLKNQMKKLNSEQEVQGCDTTGDAKS